MTTAAATPEVEPAEPKKKRKWLKRTIITIVTVIVVLLALIIGALLWFQIPTNSAGLAAQTVCAGTFTSGRNADDVFTQDVLPQSPALSVVSTSVDEPNHKVTAKFLGIFSRTASLLPDRGCVLDVTPDPAAQPFTSTPNNPAQWPAGDAAVPPSQWGAGVNAKGLENVVNQAFVGAGDPKAANARGLAVVQDGKLLIQKQADGFPKDMPLLGWSMTKTVNAMVFYKRANEQGFDPNTLVVNAFPKDREPAWVADWRNDSQKSKMTVNDLLGMKSGLDFEDDYGPTAKVVQMLYGEPSMAGFAASQPMAADPGTTFAYSTGVADIISQVTEGMFASDQDYWAYWNKAVFQPIGVKSGTFATDTSGTWVGGSYVYASTGDWAKLGQLMLNDGAWNSKQVVPQGWWKFAGTPSLPTGEGNGYGAQTWIPAQPKNGECASYPDIPKDTLSMEGHYGQVVAMVPSKKAVIVRLGWTVEKSQFDNCKLISDVLKNLPDVK
ncbi:MAG: serine hydrolase domain-containing protein [Candidatus Nanopelagicales bacterium]